MGHLSQKMIVWCMEPTFGLMLGRKIKLISDLAFLRLHRFHIPFFLLHIEAVTVHIEVKVMYRMG